MTTDHKRFGPLIGGCVGGTVGYLAAAAFGPVAAVGMFFLGAYVGYDFRSAARHFGRACTSLITRVQTHGPRFVENAKDFLRHARKYWYAYAVWAAMTVLWFNFIIGDSAMHQLNRLDDGHSPFIPRVHLPYTVDVLQTVVTGDSRYFPEDNVEVSPRIGAFAVVLVFGILAGIFGAVFLGVLEALTFLLRALAKGALSTLKMYRQWPLTVAWALFWVLALPTVGVAWVVAASLTAMYTVRRLACGIVTVATGIGYLWLVPVPVSTALVGAAAIGCGLTCGLSAHGLFALVGYPSVLSRLRALRERTVRSFSPLPTLPWWDAWARRREQASIEFEASL